MAHARPLLAWSTAQLEAIARLLQGAQQAWWQAWGLPEAASCVTCAHASEHDLGAAWQVVGSATAGAAWMSIPAVFDEALTRDLWGSTGPVGRIATRITRTCRADLQARLCAALQLQPAASALAEVPPSCITWSGMVRASLAAGAQLLLDAAAVEHLLGLVPELARPAPAAGAGAPVAPIADALASVPFPLRVRLADCELDFASLQDLRVGDVVPLPHRLDAPLLVRDARQEVVFAGYLARRGPHKALELAAPATVAPQPH